MANQPKSQRCPLCFATGRPFFHDTSPRNRGGQGVAYHRCPTCQLVYMLPHQFLSAAAEKEVYGFHENSPDDPAYRRFLGRLYTPMIERLSPQSSGFDFGSGPGPTLSVMFAEAGHTMAIYDPFFAPDKRPFRHQYDFVTATEVVEHLHQPRQELDRLWNCLKPGGLFGIMTKRVRDQQAFASWHYKNDPTHVCFFALDTFQWLADHWQAHLEILGKDTVLFTKLAQSLSE